MQTITEEQIEGQIEGRTIVEVIFPDVDSDFLELYVQIQDDKEIFFIQPAFLKSKQINQSVYDELCAQFTEEQEFNTDPKIIGTELSYDDFYEKYYNNIDCHENKNQDP
jgi:hypothetical protein